MRPILLTASLCFCLSLALPMNAATQKAEFQAINSGAVHLLTSSENLTEYLPNSKFEFMRADHSVKRQGMPKGLSAFVISLQKNEGRRPDRNHDILGQGSLNLLNFHVKNRHAQMVLQNAAGQPFETFFDNASLITVPLPSTFPMFLGLCLGTAFLGRKKRGRRSAAF